MDDKHVERLIILEQQVSTIHSDVTKLHDSISELTTSIRAMTTWMDETRGSTKVAVWTFGVGLSLISAMVGVMGWMAGKIWG